MTWKIQAINGEATGQEIKIDRDTLVGRHQSADLVLPQAEISRKHAAFLFKNQALWLQDLNSSNGTFVNDARIEHDTLLKEGDIVQFASLKFSVLALAKAVNMAPQVPQDAAAAGVQENSALTAQQPSEAVAVSETAQAAPEKSAAQQMNEQGMPQLAERHDGVQLSRDGMPQNVAVPKPAPIPEGVDITAVKTEPAPIAVEQPQTRVEEEKEQQKNASVGLISVIILIVLAVLAWLLFK